MKKVFALLLTLALIFSLSVPAFAVNSDGESYTRGSITIKNPKDGETYTAYKILDVTYSEDGTKYAYTIAPDWVNDVVAYATPTKTTLAEDWTTTTANGLTVTKNAAGGYNVTIDDNFSAPDFGEKMAAKTGTGKTAITFEAQKDGTKKASNLDLGYYMVQPTSANALVSLTTTDTDVQVSDKNEKPVVDKNIVEEETKSDHTTKSVGDKVEFELDTKVPDMTGYKTYFFVMNDTMTAGLTFNEDVTVTLNGEQLNEEDDYTVKVTNNENGTTNIRIVFKDMKQWWSNVEADDHAGDPIVITYSATVDEDAVMGTGANSNSAKIEYSNDPNIVPEYDPQDPTDPDDPPVDPDDPKDPHYKYNKTEETTDDPVGESVEDKVTVYTAELDITKVDANGGATLTGAKFKIEGEKLNVSIVNKTIFEEDENGTYYRLKDGKYTETPPYNVPAEEPEMTYVAMPADFAPVTVDGGETTYNTPGLYYENGEDAEGKPKYDIVTDENCKTLYENNYTRTYYTGILHKRSDLYEDDEKKYKKVEVIDMDNTKGTEKYTAEGFVDENGKITFGGLAEGTYQITELIAPDGYNILKAPVEIVITLVADDAGNYAFQATVDDAEDPISEAEGVLSFNIANSQGVELPETGGIGTTLFYVLGTLLVLGAGILLVAKKRMGND